MVQLWIVNLIALLALASPFDLQRRIVGGTVPEPFKYPWMVSIQNLGKHFCGGVLINPTTMVTAAHCSQRDITPMLRVYAHKNKIHTLRFLEGGFRFKVTSIASHPKFNVTQNDIAVWKLKLTAGSEEKLPIGLVEFDDGQYSHDGRTLEISGWGRTESNSSLPGRVLATEVQVVSRIECSKSYPELDPNSICAAGPGRDTCQGDSGGPLFFDKGNGKAVLVGLTSYGNGCGVATFPGVYARISGLRDWINTQI